MIVFLTLLSVKIIVLFHLLMMEELNSETMILLLSVLISKIVSFVIVQSVKIVLLIFIIVQVLYVIFYLVLIILLLLIVKLVIMMSVSNISFYKISYLYFCLALSVKIVLGFLVCILLTLNI